jgi:hypothetical protein
MLVTVISVPLGMLLWAHVPPKVWYQEASPLSTFLGAAVVVVVGLTVVVVGFSVVVVGRLRTVAAVDAFFVLAAVVVVNVAGAEVATSVAAVVSGESPATADPPADRSRRADRLAR